MNRLERSKEGRMDKVACFKKGSVEDKEPKHLLHGVLEITIDELKLEKFLSSVWAVCFLPYSSSRLLCTA